MKETGVVVIVSGLAADLKTGVGRRDELCDVDEGGIDRESK